MIATRTLQPGTLLRYMRKIVIPSEVPRAFVFPRFSGARDAVRGICSLVLLFVLSFGGVTGLTGNYARGSSVSFFFVRK